MDDIFIGDATRSLEEASAGARPLSGTDDTDTHSSEEASAGARSLSGTDDTHSSEEASAGARPLSGTCDDGPTGVMSLLLLTRVEHR
jgi:hypothetical protein